ncbi:MAG: hypothetical protein GWN51_00890 [Gemmatimonadetes bacterium]|nr:hypothetical protein [Gemmatimonadota bacterium]NIT66723.1 hypothetical protein [Gemmatimonadota bacterium]NIV22208.1 hypothetical protein [Gemmatimonadota bacterium]NIW36089.1 hypothetical protein [Gemmatimonadota bacterium]NIW73945.1 hypothetical protein [Gemmatimonadota bacterium]
MLILLALAAGLVAPAIITREGGKESELARVFSGSQQLAARRGETVRVHVEADGAWRVEGAASIAEGVLASGRLDEFAGPAFTLVVAPIGTCGYDVRSTEAALAFPVDPLTCELNVEGGAP